MTHYENSLTRYWVIFLKFDCFDQLLDRDYFVKGQTNCLKALVSVSQANSFPLFMIFQRYLFVNTSFKVPLQDSLEINNNDQKVGKEKLEGI